MTALGIDGCRAGWVGVYLDNDGLQAMVARSLPGLLAALPVHTAVLIDIPIGLPHGGARERECDQAARRLLRSRAASVFSPPSRRALGASSHREACDLNIGEVGKGLSLQAFNILPKIREVDG